MPPLNVPELIFTAAVPENVEELAFKIDPLFCNNDPPAPTESVFTVIELFNSEKSEDVNERSVIPLIVPPSVTSNAFNEYDADGTVNVAPLFTVSPECWVPLLKNEELETAVNE